MLMKIIDNALSEKDFSNIKNMLMGNQFSWYYNSSVANSEDKENYYFTHTFFENHKFCSQYVSILKPIFEIINPKALIRIKANMYPKTEKILNHGMHSDQEYKHLGAIYYINNNNGYTKLGNGKKIDSLENRLMLFDSSIEHCSTSCTDENVRININFNYF
jgi:hypothetical protein